MRDLLPAGGFVALLLLLAVVFVVTVTFRPGEEVTDHLRYTHDDAHGVGCWTFSGTHLSCLPDSEYRP